MRGFTREIHAVAYEAYINNPHTQWKESPRDA